MIPLTADGFDVALGVALGLAILAAVGLLVELVAVGRRGA